MKKMLFVLSSAALLTACSSSAPSSQTTDLDTTGTSDAQLSVTDSVALSVDYANADYKFYLGFPADFEGYQMTEDKTASNRVATLYFKTKEGVDAFAVSVWTKDEWDAEQAVDEPKPTLLGSNDQYTFGWDSTQDSAGVETIAPYFDDIRASFRAF